MLKSWKVLMAISLKLKRLTQSKFIRNVILVASGTAGAQAITMAFAPVITRIYGPEAFGLLGTFRAILGIATPLAALTYPIAIVLPKSDDDARGLAKLSLRLALIMALLLTVILLFFSDSISELLNVQEISVFLLLIPLAMFFSALQQIMQQWLVRKNQFRVTARIAISQSFILNSSKVGAGMYSPVGAVLIVLATIGNALYAIQLWFGSNKWSNLEDRINKPITQPISLKKLAYKYRDFPYYRASQVFLNSASQSLPILLLTSFFGPVSAGLYALGGTVLSLPSALLGKAVSDVFYPKIAQVANEGKELHTLVIKATALLGFIGIIPYGIVFLFGPWLFTIVFGSEWQMAGEYARWLSLWLFFAFMNRPSVATIPVLSLQGYFLIYEIMSIVLRVLALTVGFFIYNNDLTAVILFSSVSALLNFILIFATVLKSKA